MVSKVPVRARKDGDKQRRRRTILDAALAVWNKTTWNGFTMNAVAGRAGLVKGTLYLYFATKEELLLAVFEELFADYFDSVDGRLSAGHGRWDAKRVARTLAAPLKERAAFLRLLSVLGSVLEHNIDFDRARAFKRLTLDRFAATGRLIESRLPHLRGGGGLRAVLALAALSIGLSQMAWPAPVLEDVFEAEPDLRVLRVEFQPAFIDAMTRILGGKS